MNEKGESWFAIANFSQYLWLKEAPDQVTSKLRGGQVLNGVGVIGRVGYAPQATNPITRDASIALFAHGIFDSRPYDSAGLGVYYNAISDDLKNSVRNLSFGTREAKDEWGTEVFYGLALAPAVRLIASYQYIRNPLAAQVAEQHDKAEVVGVRLTVAC